MGIQEAFIALAKDKEIAGRARRILDYLFGKLGFENYICITKQEIGKEHVSREMRKLIDKGIIFKGPKIGKTASYRLNSQYWWQGNIKNLSKDRIGEITKADYLKLVKE